MVPPYNENYVPKQNEALPAPLTQLFNVASRSVTSCENEELSETIYREFSDSLETSLREVYGRRVRSPSHLG